MATYSSYLNGCLFCSLEKSPWYVPAKYSEINNTEQCPRRNEKYIFYICFAINFCIPAKLLFSLNFHNFSFSADAKNKRDPNEPILTFIHPGLPNMNGNMSRKIKCTYINQNMKNLQNKYWEPVVYVVKHYVRDITTTVKVAFFVEIYFLGWIFQVYCAKYISVDKQRLYVWHEFIFTVEDIFKIFRR